MFKLPKAMKKAQKVNSFVGSVKAARNGELPQHLAKTSVTKPLIKMFK
jgi:hypothetical protein